MRSHDPERPLLCETCGYVIEGLPREGVCPECGRSIESSLPEARIGTVWQRAENPGWHEAWQTMRAMLRKPRATFDVARIDEHRCWDLLAWCVMDASLCSVTWALVAWTAALFSGDAKEFLILAIITGAFALSSWSVQVVVILLLARIERAGMMFIGARHRWRIDGTVSRVVCAHAALGWLTGGVLVSSSFAVLVGVFVTSVAIGSSDPWWVIDAFVYAYLGSWFLGLLHFECLVYLGMRRCRYANRPPPRNALSPNPASEAASS